MIRNFSYPIFFGFLITFFPGLSSAQKDLPAKVPVIFDTDIGEDIDDTWALAFLLCCPELDLRMVTTEFNDTTAKAQIAAKFLHRVGKGDIPVGIGMKTGDVKGYQYAWAEHFKLEDYPGEVASDGVDAMINLINRATETITIIVTGPCLNIQEMLRRAPEIAGKVNVVASMGSINKGYGDIYTPDAEYNVRKDAKSAAALINSNWKLMLSPLDVSSVVTIRGLEYQKLLEYIALQDRTEDEYTLEELVQLERWREQDELILAREPEIPYEMPLSRRPIHNVIYSLMESYRAWLDGSGVTIPPDARSTILYDTLAVYLAFSQEGLEMHSLKVSVDFTGYTRITPNGKTVLAALNWRNESAIQSFQNLLVNRLIAGIPKKPEEIEAAKKNTLKFKKIGGS